MSYHRISHSEADLPPEDKLFAVTPDRSFLTSLAYVVPSLAAWLEAAQVFFVGLFYFGAVLGFAIFIWKHTS
jgi:hypothetical protein